MSDMRSGDLVPAIRRLHEEIRSALRRELAGPDPEDVVGNFTLRHGDSCYPLDVKAEKIIDSFFTNRWAGQPVTLVSEGIGVRTYPAGATENQARYRILIDPIDGTRELMYDKRSAWILTGVAANRGVQTTTSDIFLAMQTEAPPSKQTRSSVLWAVRGEGCTHELWDLEPTPRLSQVITPRPSQAADLEHGFAVFVDFFFPGPGLEVSTLARRVLTELLPKNNVGAGRVFSDQYISTGGQIYLLTTGRYRFVADIRSLLKEAASKSGASSQFMCAHPYDLSTTLIATEAGAVITDEVGQPLAYPLDAQTDCAWVGYGNSAIRQCVEAVLHRELAKLTVPEPTKTKRL